MSEGQGLPPFDRLPPPREPEKVETQCTLTFEAMLMPGWSSGHLMMGFEIATATMDDGTEISITAGNGIGFHVTPKGATSTETWALSLKELVGALMLARENYARAQA